MTERAKPHDVQIIQSTCSTHSITIGAMLRSVPIRMNVSVLSPWPPTLHKNIARLKPDSPSMDGGAGMLDYYRQHQLSSITNIQSYISALQALLLYYIGNLHNYIYLLKKTSCCIQSSIQLPDRVWEAVSFSFNNYMQYTKHTYDILNSIQWLRLQQYDYMKT